MLWILSSSSGLRGSVEAGTGGVIVSCHVSNFTFDTTAAQSADDWAQDVSSNGISLNGHKIRRTSVIVMDGDLLEIVPSKSKSYSLSGCSLYNE